MALKKILLLSYKEEYSKDIFRCMDISKYRYYIAGNKKENKNLFDLDCFCGSYDIPFDFRDEINDNDVLNKIVEIVNDSGVEVVCPSDFESLKFVSRSNIALSDFLKVAPVPDPKSIEQLDDKYDSYLILKKYGFLNPKTFLIDSHSCLKNDIVEQIGFPFLIKPRVAAGGKGIVNINGMTDLDEYLQNTDNDVFVSKMFLAQEYVEGTDYCFYGYATKGNLNAWAIFRYIKVGKSKKRVEFVEFLMDNEIFSASIDLIQKTNYTGPIVVDFRKSINDANSFIIEINPRFGAQMYYSIDDGINLMSSGIELSSNPDYEMKPYNKLVVCRSLKELFFGLFLSLDFSLLPIMVRVGFPQLIRRTVRRFKINSF